MSQSILVVDPDVYLIKALSLFLRRDGHTVIKLDGTGDVICAIRHYAPDLIIVDEQAGAELAGMVRQDAHTMHLPVIMLGLWDDPNRGWLDNTGLTVRLIKPITQQKLLVAVRSL